MAAERLNFRKKIFKNVLLTSDKGDEAETCINVHDISLYINFFFFFFCHCSCAFVAMATYSFHSIIMGKVEIGIYFCVIADILKNV